MHGLVVIYCCKYKFASFYLDQTFLQQTAFELVFGGQPLQTYNIDRVLFSLSYLCTIMLTSYKDLSRCSNCLSTKVCSHWMADLGGVCVNIYSSYHCCHRGHHSRSSSSSPANRRLRPRIYSHWTSNFCCWNWYVTVPSSFAFLERRELLTWLQSSYETPAIRVENVF